MQGVSKFFGMAVVAGAMLLGAATSASAQTYTQDQLLGPWECPLNTPDGGNMHIVTSYRPDGEFVTVASSLALINGRTLELHMFATGAWNVRGDQLTEIGQSFELVWARIDGQQMTPGDPMWNVMINGLNQSINASNVRTIEALSATNITVNYQGDRLTCRRPS